METRETLLNCLEQEPHKLIEILMGFYDRIEEQNKRVFLMENQLEAKGIIIRKLEEEHHRLKEEHCQLKEEHLRMKEENQKLKEENQKLREENQELRDRLGLNSKNSSKPPSTDGYKKPAKKRKPSDKPIGGQKGHKGVTRMLSDQPDEIIALEATTCHCGRSLEKEKVVGHEKRQVWDIPMVKCRIIEYLAQKKKCPHCKQVHTASFPMGVTTRMQYGPNIKATAAYWNQHHMLPFDRLSQSFKDLYHLEIAPSTLVNCVGELAKMAEPFYEEVRKAVIHSNVAGFDETSMRKNGKLKWLHTSVTEMWSFFSIQENRGKKGMDQAGVLPVFKGMGIHDGWKAYFSYAHASHSLCHAHLLRELERIIETTNQEWAHKMKALFLESNDLRNAYMLKRQKIPKTNAEELEARFYEILRMGFEKNPEPEKPPNQKGKPKRNRSLNLLRRFREDPEAVLIFIRNPNIPFTNNLAERSFRMAKVKEKISGGFRGGGDEHFAIIRTLSETLKKRGCSVFDAIWLMFQGYELVPR